MSNSSPVNPNGATLITGASSGIGRQIALHLSRSRRSILHGRDSERLAETRESCRRPDEHLCWDTDLSRVESIDASLTELLERHETAVAEFVHCAGMLAIRPL